MKNRQLILIFQCLNFSLNGAKRLKELFDKPLDKVRENDEVV